MRSFTVWKSAERPNYNTNINKRFPYSEVPYLEENYLVKIPVVPNDRIQHIDYWGEGKITGEDGIRGFPNCYNVNHQYQLVSSGPDLDRKIPNRIPVRSDDHCDTSSYIEDNSVLIVTVAEAARITSSCAKDIARIVNNDHGKVVVYGAQSGSQEILELAVQLAKKDLSSISNATLPRELQGLTYYDTQVAFLKQNILKDELYNNAVAGNYDTAVEITKSLRVLKSSGESINKIVIRLISACPRNTMIFAYKLWHGGAEDIVRNHFPKTFQHIFNEDLVTIVNKKYNQPLIFDLVPISEVFSATWGAKSQEITSDRVSWKVLPFWFEDGVRFRLYNIYRTMYLILSTTANKPDDTGDKYARGTRYRKTDCCGNDLEPLYKNGSLMFYIKNFEHEQSFYMDDKENEIGERNVYGHKGSLNNEDEVFMWVIEPWSSTTSG